MASPVWTALFLCATLTFAPKANAIMVWGVATNVVKGVLSVLSSNNGSSEGSATQAKMYAPGQPETDTCWLGAQYAVSKKPKEPSVKLLDQSRIIQLSADKPRAYLYKGFLTDEECDYVITKASPNLERSRVISGVASTGEVSDYRTSSGTFIEKGTDPVIKSIERRISEWTFLPVPNQEPLQVLRYTKGQKYSPHYDYFPDPPELQQGGQRYATVLMYLNEVDKGGETVFTNAPDPTPKDDTWSDCAKGFLAVKPHKGDALLFFDMHPDGSPDPYSMHYACPVIEGVKWSAPKWVHVRSYDAVPIGDPNACEDYNANCGGWANAGECDKNTAYMETYCRKACGKCTAKAE